MVETILIVLSLILLIAGIAGCILPILPGPPLGYAGVLLLHFTGTAHFTTSQLIWWLAIVVILQVMDYITPILGSKMCGGTKAGNRGCTAGMIIGLFFLPWGIIVGPFLGAVAGELSGGSNLAQAIRAGFGSLIGFMFGTLMKLFICFYLLVQSITAITA